MSSQRLLVYLEAHHAPHATASSNLTADGAALLADATTSQVLLDSARHYRPKPVRREVYWYWQELDREDDWYWVDERRIWKNWVGPDQLTTSQAAGQRISRKSWTKLPVRSSGREFSRLVER